METGDVLYTLFMLYLLWRDSCSVMQSGGMLCAFRERGERAIDKKKKVRKRGDRGGGDGVGVLGRWW